MTRIHSAATDRRLFFPAAAGNIAFLLALTFSSFCGCKDSIPRDDGRLVAGPRQTSAAGALPWKSGEYTITPLARYDVEARVLSTSRYWFGRESNLSPLDFVLGWGNMSAPGIYTKLHIRQALRFYGYSWGPEGPPIPQPEIASSSANTHLIPANNFVARKLRAVKEHQIVHLKGFLVGVAAPDGWTWTSSLRRDDEGAGACELLWVEEVL